MKKIRSLWFSGLCVCGVLVLGGCGTYEEKPLLWDAHSRTIAWKPLVESVNISRARGVVFLKGSKSSLHIAGTAGEAGFAESGLFPIDELKNYSASAAVKVDEDQKELLIPHIKCQFFSSEPNAPLGEVTFNLSSAYYDRGQMGRWYFPSAQFSPPPGTEQYKLAIVQNSDSTYASSLSQSTDIYINFIDIRPAEQ